MIREGFRPWAFASRTAAESSGDSGTFPSDPALPKRGRWLAFAGVLLAFSSLGGCASAPPAPAARDRFPLDPREGLAGPFEDAIERGWQALSSGDAKRARREFERAATEPSRRAGAIGGIEALVLADRAEEATRLCADALSGSGPTLPLWTACAEAYARTGEPAAAFLLYERAAERSPGRPGLAERTEELRAVATETLLAAAEREASEGQREAARSKVAQALAWNPGDAAVWIRAAEVECAAGERESALRYYRDALALGALDDASAERAGELALEMGDYSTAVPLFESLAARSPRLRERAAEARLAFRIDNWPEPERQAARSRRLTRAGAALLVSWMFPEVREAKVKSGIVASDVLERKDSRIMMRAAALGLLDVDAETHRARPDAPLSRGAAAQLMVRLATLLGKGAPSGCLAVASEAPRKGPEAVRLATRCGLLSESGGGYVAGPEMTRGLDRLRSAFGESAHRD
jgi:tetratricopeptide (TPR) repeat protein